MKHGCVSQVVDSPIEKYFLDGWVRNNLGAFTSRDDSAEGCRSHLRIITPLGEFNIFTQKRIGPHRVDFLCTSQTRRVVVECDGHAFHERTAEQVQRDRKRERELVRMGYSVMRFTGSELNRDSSACALEIQKYLENGPWS